MKMTWPERCRNVYARLQDETSREIFMHRMNYSTTGDIRPLVEMVRALPESKAIYQLPRQKAYIFGAGNYGKKTKRFLSMEWIGFIDNNNQKRGGGTTMVCPYSPSTMCRAMR